VIGNLENSLRGRLFGGASGEFRGFIRADDTCVWLVDSVTPRKSKRRVPTGFPRDVGEGTFGDFIAVSPPSALTPQKVEIPQDGIDVTSCRRSYRYERAVDIASPSFQMMRGSNHISIPLVHVTDESRRASERLVGRKLSSGRVPRCIGSNSDARAKKTRKTVDGKSNIGEQGYISALGRDILQCDVSKSVLLRLRGINIQWPFSQLLLFQAKTKEVRKYALGYMKIGLENEDSRICIWGAIDDYELKAMYEINSYVMFSVVFSYRTCGSWRHAGILHRRQQMQSWMRSRLAIDRVRRRLLAPLGLRRVNNTGLIRSLSRTVRIIEFLLEDLTTGRM